MALDISPIQNSSPGPAEGQRPAHTAEPGRAAGAPMPPLPDLAKMLQDLQGVSVTFNRRLSFSVNEKLGQVVVKVIDLDTDKVVREIPPTELQHVYERIREVIGLLFDEKA